MFNKDTPKHETRVPCVGQGFNPPWPTEVGPTTRHSCRLWELFHVNGWLGLKLGCQSRSCSRYTSYTSYTSKDFCTVVLCCASTSASSASPLIGRLIR